MSAVVMSIRHTCPLVPVNPYGRTGVASARRPLEYTLLDTLAWAVDLKQRSSRPEVTKVADYAHGCCKLRENQTAYSPWGEPTEEGHIDTPTKKSV